MDNCGIDASRYRITSVWKGLSYLRMQNATFSHANWIWRNDDANVNCCNKTRWITDYVVTELDNCGIDASRYRITSVWKDLSCLRMQNATFSHANWIWRNDDANVKSLYPPPPLPPFSFWYAGFRPFRQTIIGYFFLIYETVSCLWVALGTVRSLVTLNSFVEPHGCGSSMRTLPSHIAIYHGDANHPSHIAPLVAICEGRIHMMFSWSSKGTHFAPLENDGIHIHLHTVHLQLFCIHVITYPSHFVPYLSFRTHFYFALGNSVHNFVISHPFLFYFYKSYLLVWYRILVISYPNHFVPFWSFHSLPTFFFFFNKSFLIISYIILVNSYPSQVMSYHWNLLIRNRKCRQTGVRQTNWRTDGHTNVQQTFRSCTSYLWYSSRCAHKVARLSIPQRRSALKIIIINNCG